MSTTILKQRNGTLVTSFELAPDSVLVKEKSLFSSMEYQVPYVNISNDSYESTEYSRGALGFTVLGLLLLAGVITAELTGGETGGLEAVTIWGVVTAFFGTLFYLSWRSYRGFPAYPYHLVFEVKKRSRVALEEFLAELEVRRSDAWQKSSEAQDEGGTLADELGKLKQLRDEGAIDEGEFWSLKQRLIGIDVADENPKSLH